MHTSANGRKDCRVNVDGAPTIFCFHASCAMAVAEANRRLRRELGASPWELRLPDGVFESRMKAGLEAFGCDPKVFTYSQPVRVPGAWRDGKMQRLIWLRG